MNNNICEYLLLVSPPANQQPLNPYFATTMIKTTNLQYSYPGQPPITFPNLACARNEHLLILGSSGTGKTTLLHLLGGILSPTSGEIVIDAKPMHTMTGRALDHFRGERIGIVFQRPHFIRSLSAIENLLLTQSLAGHPSDRASAQALLDRLNIGSKAAKKTSSLSLGEQQRLAIARALINKPTIILADEPSSSLDDENCQQMIDLLHQVATEYQSNLVIVTHDFRIKDRFSNQVYLN